MTMQRALIQAADRAAGALGVLDRPLETQDLLRRAGEGAALEAGAIAEPLQVLVRSYAQEAELSLIGRFAARWDILRFLSNLARLNAEERRRPEIRFSPVPAPIVVTGLPRSGTTFLHRLLAEDPAHRVPRVWEAIYPYPNAADAKRGDRRRERVARQLRTFVRLAPEFPQLHPINPNAPQECTE